MVAQIQVCTKRVIFFYTFLGHPQILDTIPSPDPDKASALGLMI